MLQRSLTSACLSSCLPWWRASRLMSSQPSNLRPAFNPQATFRFTDPPCPSWNVGDGISTSGEHSKDHEDGKRKTWDLENTPSGDTYRLLTSAIIPRPIAFVSSLSKNGEPNLAPFSYFSMVSHNPPLLSVSFSLSPRRPKDTRENLLATKEFTVNIISEAFVEAANSTSVEAPADVDEWIVSGLTMEPSTTVKPAIVRESAVSMECELHSFQDISPAGSSEPTVTVVLGAIRKIHVKESVLSDDLKTVDPSKLRPVARLGGISYSRLLEGFDMPRLPWKDIEDKHDALRSG
ncbi:hypothetical protein BDQ12DRAFT_673569 [Crucibulum laeve]|uniref:Flavin reductase like domain-containing protein n=1 Tax=Crucibulum laeve TaxID=68775 RepID=A0A5C3MH89_9AGAR|nr:hypothetical protein BDQ12DRAFT_673569 [Crucibulum laeve]